MAIQLPRLPWWYGFRRRLWRWFWHTLLRRPPRWWNWTIRYTNVRPGEVEQKARALIDRMEWRKPVLPEEND
jgi:hypothetical protein